MATLFKPQPPPRNGNVATRPKPPGGFDLLLQELAAQSAAGASNNVESPRGRSTHVVPATSRPPSSSTRAALGDMTNHQNAYVPSAAKRHPSAGPKPPLTARDPKTAAVLARFAAEGLPPSGASAATTTSLTPRATVAPASSTLLDDPATSSSSGLPTAEAIAKHASCLTLFETKEIFNYPTVYYCGQRCTRKINASVDSPGSNNYGYDDAQGDFKVIMDDHVAYRYEVLQPLGRGSFGQVSKALDHKTKQPVALKIIKNKKKFHEQALVEVKVLKHLNSKDTDGSCRVVRMLNYFNFRNHMVIVFELHGQSLYDLHKAQRFAPMTESAIRGFAKQMLHTLVLTHREHVVHCDLKPENVLLETGSKSAIRVIDFGSACFDTERLYTYIQSRFYRAPEVLLGIPYTPAIDMWSLGCMLAEFAGGYPLFPGDCEAQQMLLIMETLGLPPRTMLDRAPRKRVFFDSNGAPKLVPNSRGKTPRPSTKALGDFVRNTNPDFLDLLRGLLAYEPEERLRPSEALKHPFFLGGGVTPSSAANVAAGDANVVLPRLQPSKRRGL